MCTTNILWQAFDKQFLKAFNAKKRIKNQSNSFQKSSLKTNYVPLLRITLCQLI